MRCFVGKDKVGIIYVGETEGFGGPLQVAYGIRFEDDAIIGVSVFYLKHHNTYKHYLNIRFLTTICEREMADETLLLMV